MVGWGKTHESPEHLGEGRFCVKRFPAATGRLLVAVEDHVGLGVDDDATAQIRDALHDGEQRSGIHEIVFAIVLFVAPGEDQLFEVLDVEATV